MDDKLIVLFMCSIIIFKKVISILSISELVKRLEEEGKIAKLDPSVAKDLLSTPLKCHRCTAMPKTIPDLKSHLMQHLK